MVSENPTKKKTNIKRQKDQSQLDIIILTLTLLSSELNVQYFIDFKRNDKS